MANPVVIEHHRTFASASSRARTLAIQHKAETTLRRSPTGWEVLAPPQLKVETRGRDYEYDLGEDDHIYEHEKDDFLIVEEMVEDQESWARSEEDGWYYADE